jgi:hypothetical protein
VRLFGTLLGGVAALVFFIKAVNADIGVRFTEAAPKDRFIFTNRSACEITTGLITIDLSTSKSGLLFDTDSSGPGENVAQAFEIARSDNVSVSITAVPDGASTAEIQVRSFFPGGEIEVTVDVDDSLRSGPRGVQMIDGSEIAGARITLATGSGATGAGVLHAAKFDSEGEALVELTGCPGS